MSPEKEFVMRLNGVSQKEVIHVGEKSSECQENPQVSFFPKKEIRGFNLQGEEIVSEGYLGCSTCRKPVKI